jgi:hypothetical protein
MRGMARDLGGRTEAGPSMKKLWVHRGQSYIRIGEMRTTLTFDVMGKA